VRFPGLGYVVLRDEPGDEARQPERERAQAQPDLVLELGARELALDLALDLPELRRPQTAGEEQRRDPRDRQQSKPAVHLPPYVAVSALRAWEFPAAAAAPAVREAWGPWAASAAWAASVAPAWCRACARPRRSCPVRRCRSGGRAGRSPPGRSPRRCSRTRRARRPRRPSPRSPPPP